MDKVEKVTFEKDSQKYIDDHKLKAYFEKLTKQVLLTQPDDPISYLIEYLTAKKHRRIMFVSGVVVTRRNEIATSISNFFNYKKIIVEDLFKNVKDIQSISSDLVNDAVFQQIENTEKHFRGIIISGYPNNYEQCIFIQHKGIIAERIFFFESSKDDAVDQYKVFYNNKDSDIENAIQRDTMNQKDIISSYSEYIDYFNVSTQKKEDIIDNMKSIIKLKDQRVYPLISPRIILIRPPHLKLRAQQISDAIAKKYGFYNISIYKQMELSIQNKTEVGKFLHNAFKQKQSIPDDIVISFLRSETSKPVAKHKGWILDGFPKTKFQLNALESYKLHPHAIFILDDDEDSYLENYKKLLIDPEFNRRYEYPDRNVANRLQNDNSTPEYWKEVIKKYKEYIKLLESQYENRTQRFKLNKENNEKILKAVDVFINNPKIFS